jgi:transcriptional regulator with XRE-family HTH domain
MASGVSMRRFHYIPEWAQERGLRQADVVREVSADKGTVSRWWDGIIPGEDYLLALTQLFRADEPAALFRHPDDERMVQLLRGRGPEERRRIIATIEAAFPRPLNTMTSDEIKILRIRLGETQTAFAERFGVDQATVSRWESGMPPRGPAQMLMASLVQEPQ